MAGPAVELSGLRAAIDPAALRDRRVVLDLEGGLVRVFQAAAPYLVPPGKPGKIESFQLGKILVRVSVFFFSPTVEMRPSATPEGLIQLQVMGLAGAVLPVLSSLVDEMPGFHFARSVIEVDLNAVLAHALRDRNIEVRLPPVREVRAGDGVLEIEF